jgi:hypothetical protein
MRRNGWGRRRRGSEVTAFEWYDPPPCFRFVQDTQNTGGATHTSIYDVTHEGRFIVTRREPGDGGLQIGVNWARELERILAAGGAR